MNNKGQALVVFILLLPIITLLIIALVDLGTIQIEKNKYQNEIKSIIDYGLNHIEDENIEQKLNTLLDKNIDAEKKLTIEKDYIKINVKKEYPNSLKNLFKQNQTIDITYIGYTQNKKIIIQKE